MLKKYHILMLALLITMTVVSCKNKEKSNVSNQAPTGKPRIALVMKTLTNPFFVTMEQGARRAEQELGIELIVKTGAQETSIEQQIAIVEQLIKSKVNAIVIAPAGSIELIPVLKRAQDSGIVIVNIDNKLDDAAMKREGLTNVPFISVDNFQGAYLSAQYIANQVNKPTQAIILEGIKTAKNAQDRKNGAMKAFSENPQIKVAATKTANWKIDEAYDVTASMFKVNPKIKLIFCSNDMMAMGVIQFLKDKSIKEVLVAGFDNLNEVKPLIADGSLAVTIDQQADVQGYTGIILANKMLHKEHIEMITIIPVKVITK